MAELRCLNDLMLILSGGDLSAMFSLAIRRRGASTSYYIAVLLSVFLVACRATPAWASKTWAVSSFWRKQTSNSWGFTVPDSRELFCYEKTRIESSGIEEERSAQA